MKALIVDKKQQPDHLRLAEVSAPSPETGELLVDIGACSLNAADWRSLDMGMIPKSGIFGADVAGMVRQTGPGVTGFKVGDRVMADLSNYGWGGLAEQVSAPAVAWSRIPEGMDLQTAASLPMAGVTALQALRNKGRLKAGQEVLVVGSGGGVGSFALQLVRFFGATADAVCGPDNLAQARVLGAREVLDYTKVDFSTRDARYDLILAIHGKRPLRTWRRLLKPGGNCVVVGGAISQVLLALAFGWVYSLGSRKIQVLAAQPSPADLETLAGIVASGSLNPVIERIWSLDQAREAFRQVRAGHARGKILVMPGGTPD